MLAHSLILGRELLLSGTVSRTLGKTDTDLVLFGKALPPASPKRDILRLQPNVRAVLAEMELLDGLWVDGTPTTGVSLMGNKSEKLVTLRAPSFEVFCEQLTQVQSFADLRFERVPEILSQVVPQTAAWASIAGLEPERHRYTLELLGVGLRFAMMMVMKFKYLLNCPRPMQYSSTVQPVLLTPGYTAYPSGHATEAYFVAHLLPMLMPTSAKQATAALEKQLRRLAFRVAENRVVAGLHFPIDSIAGQVLGETLADYVAWAAGQGKAVAGRAYPNIPSGDEKLNVVMPGLDRTAKENAYVDPGSDSKAASPDMAHSPTLCTLFDEAKKEFSYGAA